MKRWMVGILAIGGGSVLLAAAVGAALPREHVATSAVTLRQPPESVWAVMRDLSATPRWWSQVASSTRVTDARGREVWHQVAGGFSLDLVVTEAAAPVRLVTTVDADADASFGGTWTYHLAPVEGGTRILVTEAGWISNPLFRVIARVTGLHRTLDSYLTDLGGRFGEAVTPEHVVR